VSWLYLILAIACEVVATLSIRASEGMRNKRWLPAIIGGYIASFILLSLALAEGLALGVAYGIWAAVGVAATAVLARAFFREPLTRLMSGGIALIAAGVLIVEIGANAAH
jgi:small multidrug resistance pump